MPFDGRASAIYREFRPSPAAIPFVICTWTLDVGAGGPHRQRILPDGCADIVWIGDDEPLVVGPMTRSFLSAIEPGTTVVGVRFRPEAAARVLGVAAYELVDRRVTLGDVWGRRLAAASMAEMAAQPTSGGRVAVLQQLLALRGNAVRTPDPIVALTVSRLTAPTHLRVDRLARDVGISERQLRRRFLAAVGYSPKMFHRIARFQRLLALSAHQSGPMGEVAHRAGYADQAHMTREVGEFAGVTPSALLGRVESALTPSDRSAQGIAPG